MISVSGPYRRIGNNYPYEVNENGIVRTAFDHSWGPGFLVKPTIAKNGDNDSKQRTAKIRYRLYSNDSDGKRMFKTLRNMLREVWGIERDFTDEEYQQILELCDYHNSERHKERGGECKDATPITVNGKPRHCWFCGKALTSQDGNYFYHSKCFENHNPVYQVEDIFHGGIID